MNAQWLLPAVIVLLLLVDAELGLEIIVIVAVILGLSWAADAFMHRNDEENRR